MNKFSMWSIFAIVLIYLNPSTFVEGYCGAGHDDDCADGSDQPCCVDCESSTDCDAVDWASGTGACEWGDADECVLQEESTTVEPTTTDLTTTDLTTTDLTTTDLTTTDLTTTDLTTTDLTKNIVFPLDFGVPSFENGTVIGDSYERLEVIWELWISSSLDWIQNCDDCFEWMLYSNDDDDDRNDFNDLFGNDSPFQLTFYNEMIKTLTDTNGNEYNLYKSYVVVGSIRDKHSGYCTDQMREVDNPLQPGTEYKIKLKISNKNDGNDDTNTTTFESQIISFKTNDAPIGGSCSVMNLNDLNVLDTFDLNCIGWESQVVSTNDTSLQYNALFSDVIMNKQFTYDATNITGLVGVGQMDIIALIQDSLDGLTCYKMSVQFPSIQDLLENQDNETAIIENILRRIDNILNSEMLGENNDITVSLWSVINALYEGNYIDDIISGELVESVVANVIDTSVVLDGSNVSLSSELILSEVSTLSIALSNGAIVNQDVMNIMIYFYLPVVTDILSHYSVAESEVDHVQSDLYSMTGKLQRLIENLEYSLIESELIDFDNSTEFNDITDTLTDTALHSAHMAVSQSIPGEIFVYISSAYDGEELKIVTAMKFAVNLNDSKDAMICGYHTQNFEIPSSFDPGIFDCAFILNSLDLYDDTSNEDFYGVSDLLSLYIYNENGDLLDSISDGVSECDPYLIRMILSNTSVLHLLQEFELGQITSFPGCNFWNKTTERWEESGCVVHNYSVVDEFVICACTHLTTFQVSATDFVPQANIVGKWLWRDLTVHNLVKYPTVWITILCVLILIVCVCFVNCKVNCGINEGESDKSLLAYEDIIFKKVKNQKIKNDVTGKEIEYYQH